MQKVAFILLLLIPVTAKAELKLFPMWESQLCAGGRYACYDFEAAKSIIKIDLDLQFKLKELDLCTKDLKDHQDIILKLQGMMAKDQESISALQTRLTEKDAVLVKTTEELKKMESTSIWNYIPWIIAGAAVLAGGAFVAGWYLSTD